MSALDRWPGISLACFEIALDNGGVNRSRPEKQVRRDIAHWIEDQSQDLLPAIDAWLSTLSDDDLRGRVCCGEETEMEAFLAEHAPPFTDELLNRYFNEVC